MLEAQTQYFNENKAALLKKYAGKYIVISDSLDIGSFDDMDKAYFFGVENYGLGHFLMRECSSEATGRVHIISPTVVLAQMITAYTHAYGSIVRQIIVKCHLSVPGENEKETDELNALWDTGAMTTCISEDMAERLGLTAVDSVPVIGANNEPFNAPVYAVRLRMGRFVIPLVTVLGLPMKDSGHDVIIGMDVTTRGDFTLTNYQGKTTVSFREPSLERIDYVTELNIQNKCEKIHAVNMAKKLPDKCGCGSGKDYKNCHGKSPYHR